MPEQTEHLPCPQTLDLSDLRKRGRLYAVIFQRAEGDNYAGGLGYTVRLYGSPEAAAEEAAKLRRGWPGFPGRDAIVLDGRLI